MELARVLGLALSEETITETCLYNIAKAHQHDRIAIYPATKPQEARHGADWEWWFTYGNHGIGYRVQAKRLFPSGRYNSLFKPGDQFAQLTKLVASAHAAAMIPLYCFYNFEHPGFHGWRNRCRHRYRGPSYLGCTIAFPQDVQAIASDEMPRLGSAMFPWHSLVCVSPGGNLLDSVAANTSEMAAQRRVRLPAAPDIAAQSTELPWHVRRLTELGRKRREQVGGESLYLDFELWNEWSSDDEQVSGVIVFDERS